MRSVSMVFVALALAGVMAAADASPVTYDFTVTAASGPLSGTVANGSFSFDSSSITPGAFNGATGLLTALDFTWDGITYDASTANTGGLFFDAAGNLAGFNFGSNCHVGGCSVFVGTDTWVAAADSVNRLMYYSIPGGSFYIADMTFSLAPAVPEPLTLSLFAAGLIGAGAVRRRRKTD